MKDNIHRGIAKHRKKGTTCAQEISPISASPYMPNATGVMTVHGWKSLPAYHGVWGNNIIVLKPYKLHCVAVVTRKDHTTI